MYLSQKWFWFGFLMGAKHIVSHIFMWETICFAPIWSRPRFLRCCDYKCFFLMCFFPEVLFVVITNTSSTKMSYHIFPAASNIMATMAPCYPCSKSCRNTMRTWGLPPKGYRQVAGVSAHFFDAAAGKSTSYHFKNSPLVSMHAELLHVE